VASRSAADLHDNDDDPNDEDPDDEDPDDKARTTRPGRREEALVVGHLIRGVGTGIDPDDGEPTWEPIPGQELVPDTLAWERLATGLRCETWLAWSEPAWAPVIVKLGRPGQVALPRTRIALGREADALAGCRHPALPELVADGRDAVLPYLVMSYVDGPTLSEVLDDGGPLAAVDVLLLACRLLSAVRALHRGGVAHLDLKPENVVLQDGRPVVVDLGSARPLGRRQPAGRPIGTLGYTSPELEAGASIATAMDAFGVGVTLAEVAIGRPVFEPGTPPPHRPPLDTLLADVEPVLADLLAALLDPDPARRVRVDDALAAIGDAAQRAGWDALTWPPWAQHRLAHRPDDIPA
jgi:serine/threonine protein kinase